VRRTFRYPLSASRTQEAVLESWLSAAQQLYNGALEHRIGAWRRAGKQINYVAQAVELTALRAEDPAWRAVPVVVARSSLRRLDLAFSAFFRRVKAGEKPGFPRFRAHDRYTSFNIGPIRVEANRVYVPKLGPVKFRLYRPLKGRVCDVVLRKEPSGKWFVCFSCDLGAAPVKVAVHPNAAVGIDMGLTSFATLSDGEKIPNPRFGRNGAALIARRQRALARKRRGSNGRRRAKHLVAKAYDLAKNQRIDHARKTSKMLVERYDLIAHEKLNIRGMVHGNLARTIHDAAWGLFLRCLTCKAEEAGKWIIPVAPQGTTQRCSGCGENVPKDLTVRVHDCPHCRLRLGRDHNAALNILALGRSAVAQG
jgi:putative transposase